MTEKEAMQALVNELCAYMKEHDDFESINMVEGIVERFNLDGCQIPSID